MIAIQAVVSIFFGTPLHIISTGDSPQVTAALSLGKLVRPLIHILQLLVNFLTVEGILNKDVHLVTWSSNSQGDQFFTANQNNFYLAVDTDKKIVTLPEDVSKEVCIFIKEVCHENEYFWFIH